MSLKRFYKKSWLSILFIICLLCLTSCAENSETRFKELISQGDISYANRKYKSALAWWGDALKIQPASVGVLRKVGEAYLRLAEFLKAEKVFKQILQNQPEADDILLELTKLQLVTRNIRDAVTNWDTLNSRHPDDPNIELTRMVLDALCPE